MDTFTTKPTVDSGDKFNPACAGRITIAGMFPSAMVITFSKTGSADPPVTEKRPQPGRFLYPFRTG